MPSRSKKEMSNSEKEQFLADMVVKAASNFAYLGISIDDIGIPPMMADKKMCSGHSWKDYCAICRFNYCWMCGAALHNPHGMNLIKSWSGVCGNSHDEDDVPSVEHHSRVLAMAKRMMEKDAESSGGKQAEAPRKVRKAAEPPSITIDSDDEPPAGGGWAGDRRIGKPTTSKAPRIQLSKAPPARNSTSALPRMPMAQQLAGFNAPQQLQIAQAQPLSAAQVVAQGVQPGSAAQAIAQPAVAPQINIAIAPLAQVRVESTNTTVRRIGDGVVGNVRFEVTVSVVLEQVMGQQPPAV